MVTFCLVLEHLGIHSVRVASELHKLLVRNIRSSEQQKTAGHSFFANRANLNSVAVFHHGNNGNHSEFNEVHIFRGLIWLVDYFLNHKLHTFKVWTKNVKACWRKLCQKCVL